MAIVRVPMELKTRVISISSLLLNLCTSIGAADHIRPTEIRLYNHTFSSVSRATLRYDYYYLFI
jgi:hypothetical protein